MLRAAPVTPAALWYVLFFLAPMVWLARLSFAVVSEYQISYVFSFSAYREVISESLTWELLGRSFALAAVVTLATFALGFPAAWLLSRRPVRSRNLMLALIIIPWWSSYIVRVFAWRMAFGEKGIINEFLAWVGVTHHPLGLFGFGWFGVAVAEINLYLPLMIVPLYLTLERIDSDVIRASRALGAGGLRTFFSVVLPLATPGIVTGTIFVFMPVTGEFVVPNLVGGPSNLLFGNQIQAQFGTSYNWPGGCALAVILLVLLVATLLVIRFIANRITRQMRYA